MNEQWNLVDMVPDEPIRTGTLLVVLGLATLGAGLAIGGLPADTVYQYTAAEISDEDGELTAEPVPSERSANLHQLPDSSWSGSFPGAADPGRTPGVTSPV